MSRASIVLVALLTSVPALASDPFADYVRRTDPLTPDQQQQTFTLPEGFQIRLVAAEPEIAKPMNLAFDARGRLWVTETRLYPFPAKDDAAKKDCIKILEDTDGDGRAERITTFADNLNIPIGLLPLGDGSSVIAYDVNSICRYTDTNDDGKADRREVLYTGFGIEDTHGMASNFRRGFDGWVYGCHGFKNKSEVRDRNGNVTTLESGNTYRFRIDGSKFELFTIGQINPFGLSIDPLGNLYTSDSHSKPIYQLLRGGRYEAFDRSTDDGLGLAPMMMSHLHGSTAIAGSCFYAADAFPAEFHGNIFVGNVVTGRINRDLLQYAGSSPHAVEQPDFLTTTDPWFRPVNVILGPDGALYVADFYNRIIGHYEVRLDHPARDHERGRIWKISFPGSRSRPQPGTAFDLSQADASQLIARLDDGNLANRMAAMDQLSDRIAAHAIGPLKQLVAGGATVNQKVHALWILHRLGALDAGALVRVAGDPDAAVRVHAMRIVAETGQGDDLPIRGLADPNALVRRCAAEALGRHPHPTNIRPILNALAAADHADTHLVHVLRMALRNQLEVHIGEWFAGAELSESDIRLVGDVAVAVETPEAAAFLLRHIGILAEQKPQLTRFLRHAARFAAIAPVEPVATLMRERFADDIDLQLELFESLRQGLAQRGQEIGSVGQAWGAELVSAAMGSATKPTWTSTPLDPGEAATTTWGFEQRRCDDGKQATLLSSLPGGEQRTGRLRSSAFELPGSLAFHLAGHNGFPGAQSPGKNVVRLRLEGSDEILAEALPPRSDIAVRIEWKLAPHVGKRAFLEVTDADAGSAYAWLAFGRFDPPVIALPETDPRTVQQRLRHAARLSGELKLASLVEELIAALQKSTNDTDTRGTLADALAALKCDKAVAAMKAIVTDPSEAMPLRDHVAQALGRLATQEAQHAIVESFRLAPRELQTAFALALTSNTAAAEKLLTAVADGKAPARLLLDLGIHDRLSAAGVAELDARVKQLTRGVAAPREEVDRLITERRLAFRTAMPIPSAGQEVFEKNCMACHQVDGRGGVVGPQLVGLAKRGIDRLIEDVLDPNRNVDPAFRYTTVILADDSLITGLQRRELGELLVFADTTGKDVTVRKADIRQRIESPSSLMPTNFAEILKTHEFNDLMAYLLSK